MWGIPNQGVFSSQAGSGIGFPSSHFQPLPDQGAAALKEAIDAIGQLLEKQRQDKIANQLLATDSAERATAVDGTQASATGQQPDSQLTQAMIDQNMRLGAPTTPGTPDLGGVDALKMKMAHDKTMAEIEHDLSMGQYYRSGGHSSGSGPDKVWNDYAGGMVTPSQNDVINWRREKPPAAGSGRPIYDPVEVEKWKNAQAQFDRDYNKLQEQLPDGITPEEFAQIDPKSFKFVAANDLTGVNKSAPVVTPGTFWGQNKDYHVKAGDEFDAAEAARITAAKTNLERAAGHNVRGFIQAVGTVNGKPVQIPFEDFGRLQALAKSLKKPVQPHSIAGATGAADDTSSETDGGGAGGGGTGYPTPPPAAIDALRANPEKAPEFEAKYGPGSSNDYLMQ